MGLTKSIAFHRFKDHFANFSDKEHCKGVLKITTADKRPIA